MTKEEFMVSVPYNIEHKVWGQGIVEIVIDISKTKGVCYRHKNHTASCGTYAPTWKELYQKLRQHLPLQGYGKL